MNWLWALLDRSSMARRLACRWQANSLALLHDLRKEREQLESLRRELTELADTVQENVRRAEQIEQQYQTAVEALKSENQILADVTVPTLVSSHKLLLQRYDAETAIEVRRQVAVSGSSE